MNTILGMERGPPFRMLCSDVAWIEQSEIQVLSTVAIIFSWMFHPGYVAELL